MKPLEVERPWIAKKMGIKLFALVIVVFMGTFGLLSVFGFYWGGTVNVQQVNVSFSDSKIATYSYAYGKETQGTHSTFLMELYLKAGISTSSFKIYEVSSLTSGFKATLKSGNYVYSGKAMEIPVVIETPSNNYAGSISIEVIT